MWYLTLISVWSNKSAHCVSHLVTKSTWLERSSPRATEQLVYSFVTSRLDNCNSLLFSLPDKLIHCLQLPSIEQHDSSHIPRNTTTSHLSWHLFTGYQLDHRSFLKSCFYVNPFMSWHRCTPQNLWNHMPLSRLGASTGQKYSSTSTSTWKNDEYKYKYKYWIFKSTWVQVQVLWEVLEYKYRVLLL